MNESKQTAAITRMAGAASTLAARLRQELGGGDLTRMASLLAVDLEAMALRLSNAEPVVPPRSGPRLCAMCGELGADTNGLCAICEKEIGG